MLLQEIGDRALRREPIFQDHVDLFSEALHPARAGLAIGRTGQCPRGRCTFVGRSPPPSVVGRDGLAIGRFGRFPEPPAVILYLRPPPPSTIAIPPPPARRRSALFPRFPGPNLVPSPALQSLLWALMGGYLC